MTEQEKITEAQRVVDEVNAKLKPIEDAFMAYVKAYSVVGYERMVQLINEHWESELTRERNAYIGNSMRTLP